MYSELTRRRRSDIRWAILFLAPNFLGFLVFVALPVVFSLVMAFTNWDLTEREPLRFMGLENFRWMLWGPESHHFWKFFSTTLYLMIGVPISIAGSLLLAVLLHEPLNFGSRAVRLFLATGCGLLTVVGMILAIACGQQALGLALAIVFASTAVAVVFNRVGLRTMFYLPFFTTGIAQFILWKLLFRQDSGPINASLRPLLNGLSDSAGWLVGVVMATLGFSDTVVQMVANHMFVLEAPDWLGSMDNLFNLNPQTGFPGGDNFGLGARDAIVIMGIWASVGGNNMLLYLAGLSNVPADLYEAAMIDGAGRWKTFWHVSWPQLAPTTFFIVIMSVIGGLQGGFEQARVMTEGRPADTTVTLGFYIYREGFEEFRLGYASAVSWMMFLMIFAATLLNWRFGSRRLNT